MCIFLVELFSVCKNCLYTVVNCYKSVYDIAIYTVCEHFGFLHKLVIT